MSEKFTIEHINDPGFFVTGLSVRTTNQDGRSQKDIGDLWTRFTTGSLAQQIEGKLSEDIYCVYTDYESDHTGLYTAVLGCRVDNAGSVSGGFFAALIPAGNYRVYKPQGKFPESVSNTWKQIWRTATDRKYSADFDRYKAGAKSFEETEVDVYLAIV
jgi:predicted transcriptional regulator YdeE